VSEDLGEYLYWGEPWPSGVCDEATQSNTYPLGEKCALCDERIVEGQSGTYINVMGTRGRLGSSVTTEPAHKECSLRSVLGGIGHHTQHDYWCVVMGKPDAGLTYRQSALEVWAKLQEGELLT
jgi:hypothetical protein